MSSAKWLIFCACFNSFWPSDATWRPGSGSTLGQVMACCLTALIHYLKSWTNIDFSSVRFNDVHLTAISQDIPQPSITEFSLKITYGNFHSNLPGDNELMCKSQYMYIIITMKGWTRQYQRQQWDSVDRSVCLTHLSTPGQNGHHFADDISKYIFHKWNVLYFDSNFAEVCS